MQDQISNNIQSCFFSSISSDHQTAVTRSGQSVLTSVYRTKIGDRSRHITVTWIKNLLHRSLTVSVTDDISSTTCQRTCAKVELKPWQFWRKQGSKTLTPKTDQQKIILSWDLKSAKFLGETEPKSGFYVAILCGEEAVLLLGDRKKDAYRKTACRPALADPTLVSRREHVFGKGRFSTKTRFHDKDKLHEICIDCKSIGVDGDEAEMEIRLDGEVLVDVKRLQWKFRGNESVQVNELRVEIFWDVHDWLFSPGLRHGLFIFKPVFSSSLSGSLGSVSSSSSSTSQSGSSGSFESLSAGGSGEFCLFLHAWRVE